MVKCYYLSVFLTCFFTQITRIKKNIFFCKKPFRFLWHKSKPKVCTLSGDKWILRGRNLNTGLNFQRKPWQCLLFSFVAADISLAFTVASCLKSTFLGFAFLYIGHHHVPDTLVGCKMRSRLGNEIIETFWEKNHSVSGNVALPIFLSPSFIFFYFCFYIPQTRMGLTAQPEMLSYIICLLHQLPPAPAGTEDMNRFPIVVLIQT